MKSGTGYLSLIVTLIMLSVCLCGCSHKDTECPDYDMREVTVRFEWIYAENAYPDGMTLYFFPVTDKEKVWRFDIAGRDGGTVELPEGSYRMIAFNNDLPGIRIENSDRFSTIDAVALLSAEPDIYSSTGMLYCAVISDMYLSDDNVYYKPGYSSVKECDRSVIRCFPDSISTQVTVMINDIKGAEHVKTASARIEGISESITLAECRLSDHAAELSVPLTIDKANRSLKGSACTFINDDVINQLSSLSLIITRDDGRSFSTKIDFNTESLNMLSPHNVIITLNGITIPETGDDVDGIDVNVDGWTVVEIDIDTSAL